MTCKSPNLMYASSAEQVRFLTDFSVTLTMTQHNAMSDDIGKHFNLPNHKGKLDLDFIYCDPGKTSNIC